MAFNPIKKKGEVASGEYYSSESVSESTSGSLIGKTLVIEGEVASEELLIIEGKVKGNLKVNNTLTIGESGDVNGDIEAKVIRIDGKARGNIVASEKAEISSGGKYTGNIQAEKLVIEEGAIFKGKVNMNKGTTLKNSESAPIDKKVSPPKEDKKDEKKGDTKPEKTTL